MFTFILTLLLGLGGLHPMDVGTGPTGHSVVPVQIPVHHARSADVGTGPTG